MDLETAKKLITEYVSGHADFIAKAEVAERYYRVDNDIMHRPPKHTNTTTSETDNPMRSADNRIPFSFYKLLVNQKAGYMFTDPPSFDVRDDLANEQITDDLGDAYAKKCKDLCVNASNAGVAWVHYWIDQAEGFHWGVVPSYQVIPVWSPKLDKKLLACLRVYKDYDDNGDVYDVYEYWTDTDCQAFRKLSSLDVIKGLEYYPLFTDFYVTGLSEAENQLKHDFGRPPFIPFFNNNIGSRDLDEIKHLIDAYDTTYSGFVDDLEDIQQVIFVLTNYGGENLQQFLQDLKYAKAIQIDSAGADDKSGVSTLSIEIPVEARDKLLDITRKAIFDMGQGIDPQQQGFDNTSGEAMKFLYSLLELKSGMMETEFRLGFGELVRSICRAHGIEAKHILQTWARTSIRNDAELVNMCSKSAGIVSKKTILRNHPFVENVEDEEKELEEERAENDVYADSYLNQSNSEPPAEGGEPNV